eukprot:jgi/Tetstr1/460653/TSEL_005849.t1
MPERNGRALPAPAGERSGMATLGSHQAALLVVDMQRWTRGVAEKILPAVNPTISCLRMAGMPVIFTQQGLNDPTAEAATNVFVQRLGVPSCPKVGDLGWELMPGLDHAEDDLFITSKTTYDAFYKTELLFVLLELNVDTVVICGAMTNTSVETTARSAFTQNFNVIVCSDGTAASDAEVHQHSLRNLRYGFADVLTCGVVRGRFQTPWLSARLEMRKMQLSVELPAQGWSGAHQWGARSRAGSSSGSRRAVSARPGAGAAGREEARPPSEEADVAEEEEGWWLKERRAEVRRAQLDAGHVGVEATATRGATPGTAADRSIFSKIAAARSKSDRLQSAPPTRTRERWVPPTRKARMVAGLSDATTDGQPGAAGATTHREIATGPDEPLGGDDETGGVGEGPRGSEVEAAPGPRRAQGPALFMFSSNVSPEQRLGLSEPTTVSDKQQTTPGAAQNPSDPRPAGGANLEEPISGSEDSAARHSRVVGDEGLDDAGEMRGNTGPTSSAAPGTMSEAAPAPVSDEAQPPTARSKLLGRLKRPVRQQATKQNGASQDEPAKRDAPNDGSETVSVSARVLPPPVAPPSLPPTGEVPPPPSSSVAKQGPAPRLDTAGVEDGRVTAGMPAPPAVPPPASSTLGAHALKPEGRKRPIGRKAPLSSAALGHNGNKQHGGGSASIPTTAAS